jgi:hypothetical protein
LGLRIAGLINLVQHWAQIHYNYSLVVYRGDNRTGRVRVRIQIERVGYFNFLEEIRSGRIGSELDRVSIYMLCFFRFLIDFDWIKIHLILDQDGSDWIRIRSDRILWMTASLYRKQRRNL